MEGNLRRFSALLRRYRRERGLSQFQLAIAAELSERTISDLEREINRPRPTTLDQLTRALQLSDEELAAFLAAGRRHSHRAQVEDTVRSESTDLTHPAAVSLTGLTSSLRTFLPDPLADDVLVGRKELLGQCRDLLARQRIVSLHGLPGVGKSALALKLAHDTILRRRYRGGVLFAALGPEPDLVSLLGSWGQQLQIASADAANALDADGWRLTLRQTIGDHRLLIVVDDVWRLEDFHQLKVGGPACAYLVTTRSPRVASDIAGSQAIAVPELSASAGHVLLARVAPHGVAADPTAARQLIERVGALPLALRIMGNYLRVESVSAQPRRIHAALTALTDAEIRLRLTQSAELVERRPAPSPNTRISLGSVIEVTVQQLCQHHPAGRDALRALLLLSVFPPKPSSFSEDAALEVGGIAQNALDLLYDYGLLESSAPGRYALHQVIYEYARACVSTPELRRVQRRMLAFFAAWMEEHATEVDLLTRESANILTALRVASQQPDDPTFVRAVLASAPILELRGEYQVLERLLQLAEGAARALNDVPALAQAHLHTGRLAELRGEYPQALTLYQSGLDEATTSDDTHLRITLLARCAEVALRSGSSDDAERLAKDGLTQARALGVHSTMALLLRVISQAAGNRGDLSVGDELYPEALTRANEVGDVDTAISCFQNMGTIAFKRGAYEDAVALLKQGLTRAQAIGHARRVAALQNALGCVYVRLAVTAEETSQSEQYRAYADQLLDACLRLSTAYRFPQWQNNALQNLGALARGQKRFRQAQRYLQRAQTIADAMGDRWLVAETACEVGELYLEMGRLDASRKAYERALTVATAGDDPELELLALASYGLGRVWEAKGDATKARDYGAKSLQQLNTLHFGQANEVENWMKTL